MFPRLPQYKNGGHSKFKREEKYFVLISMSSKEGSDVEKK